MFIATELSGQQGGSSGAKECLDIPCGYSGPATKVDPYSLVGGRLGPLPCWAVRLLSLISFVTKGFLLGGLLALRRIVGWWGCHLTAYRRAGVFVCLEPTLETGPPRGALPGASSRRYRSPGSLEHASPLTTSRPDPREGNCLQPFFFVTYIKKM